MCGNKEKTLINQGNNDSSTKSDRDVKRGEGKESGRYVKCDEGEEKKAELLYKRGMQFKDKKEYNDAFVNFLEAANRGHAEAMYEVGDCYSTGNGVKCDEEAEYSWMMKASELGVAKATYGIGIMYELGIYVDEDYKKAFDLYLKASEMGDKDAMYNLALCYERGTGVKENQDECERWMKLSAEKGCKQALYIVDPDVTRYEWVKENNQRCDEEAKRWCIGVEVNRKKTDYVYDDSYDDTWHKVYRLCPGSRFSIEGINVLTEALLFEKGENGKFVGVILKVSKPAGGLSLVVNGGREILLIGSDVTAGYSTGNDDFSVSASLVLTIKQNSGEKELRA